MTTLIFETAQSVVISDSNNTLVQHYAVSGVNATVIDKGDGTPVVNSDTGAGIWK